jgi:hypothetical protein
VSDAADIVRELLLDMGNGDTTPEQYDAALAALEALVKARDNAMKIGLAHQTCESRILVAEKERDAYKAGCVDVTRYVEQREQALARVRQLETDQARIVRWFTEKPWEGDPDPRDFGGLPYSPEERASGYGTYRDPRFLPDAIRAALAATSEACTGGGDCPATLHLHGCYRDDGNCDYPDHHDAATSEEGT